MPTASNSSATSRCSAMSTFRAADHVVRCKDVRDARAQGGVHVDLATLIDGHACLFDGDVVGVGASACSDL